MIKCVVWDLDGTVWDGTLLEDPEVQLRPRVLETIRGLDARGILQSVASKNEHDHAWERLTRLGIAEYFLYPKIGWGPKSEAIQTLAKDLNLGLDSFAFIDDQPFEREEVRFSLPETLCLDAEQVPALLERPDLNPAVITADAANRRRMMQADILRNREESAFVGAKEAFLATLGLELTLGDASAADLPRAAELVLRAHQLNTTGDAYSCAELEALSRSPRHQLLTASLADKYGSYGMIGLALVEKSAESWLIRLLLVSCRVMSRGIGGCLILHLRDRAREAGVSLRAEFVPTARNRMMYVTYKFNHFREIGGSPERLILENDLSVIQHQPEYLRLHFV